MRDYSYNAKVRLLANSSVGRAFEPQPLVQRVPMQSRRELVSRASRSPMQPIARCSTLGGDTGEGC
jgi:hypothetical protein